MCPIGDWGGGHPVKNIKKYFTILMLMNSKFPMFSYKNLTWLCLSVCNQYVMQKHAIPSNKIEKNQRIAPSLNSALGPLWV